MNVISTIIHKLAYRYKKYAEYYELMNIKKSLGYLGNTSVFKLPDVCSCPRKIFIYDNSSVYEHSSFIISPIGESGKFIMKSNSGAAQGLTVITNIHHRTVGEYAESNKSFEKDTNKDIVVEEDVQIGANVTLLPGIKIGRGSSIAAGSVCISNVPPYAIVCGNPAQVIGFTFTPPEIIEHEEKLYPIGNRLALETINKNYEKFYLSKISNISSYLNIALRK